MDTNVLEVKHIQKYYGNEGGLTKALEDVSLTVEKGGFLGVMGPSGSGKTTLLNCISTIDTPTAGSIQLDGEEITRLQRKQLARFRREKLGFIFQDFNLLDTLTVHENIALALTIRGTGPQKIDGMVEEVAERLGVKEQLQKFPYQISGGQKQRAAAARAIVTEPSLILADEPTGALDSKSAELLLHTLTRLNEELHSTIVMVTHDAFAASHCKRIIFIKDGSVFSELRRGGQTRAQFFDHILEVVSLLGGNLNDLP